jgi:hypothetical protein
VARIAAISAQKSKTAATKNGAPSMGNTPAVAFASIASANAFV